MTDTFILALILILSFSLGAIVFTLVRVGNALVKLINQLRFYFYVKTEVENLKRGYPYDQVKAH